jgi:hypothetical protein
VLDSPIYLRSPEYPYRLRSDLSHPLLTGVGPAGRQVLVVPGVVLEFNATGQLSVIRDGEPSCALPAGFEGQPITVRRFWLPDRRLGISDIPVGLLGLPRDPALFTEKDREYVRSSEFFEWGNFALRCSCSSAGLNQLFVSRDGECLLHSV